MGGFRRIYMTGLATTVALLFGGIATAQAVDITSSPDATSYTFTAATFVQAQGDASTFTNLGTGEFPAFHNVTSTSAGPDGNPLFLSETVTGGATAPVEGTQYLTTGSYPFVCTLHTGMNGTLEVSASGTPVPRPGVKLAVIKQKLKQVRKSGKLKVKVTPTAPSTGASLEVTKGGNLIGLVPDLGPLSSPRTVAVKLTKAGRKAIRKGKKVKFDVSSKVPWGSAAKASRTLR